MTWVIRNKTGGWFVGKRGLDYALTQYRADAFVFPDRASAAKMKADYLATFESAYELVEVDDGDDATPGPTDVV